MKRIVERHVQAIWYDGRLRPTGLTTRRGTAVRVVSPGEWNLGPGPDFRRAVLELGPEHQRIVGDVEVHLAPADWDFHGHGADPKYRNVIAHVTWGCGPVPDSLPPGAVSIWLGRFVTARTDFSLDEIDLAAYPYAKLADSERPCAVALSNNPDLARAVLAQAGRHRLIMKARRLVGRVGAAGGARRQVFYEEVMGALGYSRNTVQFRRIAARIPIGELSGDVVEARSAFLTAATFEEWDRAAVRPNNTPEARLENAAQIFMATPMMSYTEANDFSREGCRQMVTAMCHGEQRCLGKGRAGAVMANVIVPWAISEGRLQSAPDWLPPEDVSDPVRLTAYRLFGRDHNPAAFYSTNGLLIQGLLQIHRDQCLRYHPDCAQCDLLTNS